MVKVSFKCRNKFWYGSLEEFRIPPTNRSSDWYSKHITRVAPIFNHLHTKMKAINEEELHNFLHLCSWMHQPHTIELCFNLLLEPENESLNSLECLLLVTSAIERALGNVILNFTYTHYLI